MKKSYSTVLGGTILLFLFPYIFTLFVSGSISEEPKEIAKSGKTILREGVYGREEIDLEEYILGVTASQIPGNYEKEAVKVQMILARTYLYKAMGEADSISEADLYCTYLDVSGRKKEWGEAFSEYEEKFEAVASETAGQVILYEGGLADAMFHRASAGVTRDGGEGMPYMKSVDSGSDVDMENYVTIKEYSESELAAAIGGIRGQNLGTGEALGLQIVSRDQAGYVEQVMAGTEEYTGEELAAALALPSSAFSISQTEKGLKFVVKGSGHGYGVSQWGANKLALEGKGAADILNYYFQNITIERYGGEISQPEMPS
ncbi:MAG: SpoIID/LytB domain-containing protein [Lachnospiraceae bacterium]|nr:SpoIID/LytB domain-containing protein [Lachnospiraceae bacterium]